jgi:hypothetical protein
LFFGFTAKSQEYEWVKFYQGEMSQSLSSLSTDKEGNVYFTIDFSADMTFDSVTIPASWGNSIFACKKNSDGKILWYKTIWNPFVTNTRSLGSTFKKKGNQLIFIYSNGSGIGSGSLVVDSDTIPSSGISGDALFVVEFDTSGNFVSGREIIAGSMFGSTFTPHCFKNDENDNVYLCLTYYGSLTVFDTTGSYGYTINRYTQTTRILKFSEGGKKLEWHREFPGSIDPNSIDADIHGNVYMGGYWENSPSSFIFKGQTINRPQTCSGVVFILDKNGNDKNWFHILASDNQSTVSAVAAHDSNSVFVTGHFKGDSARFGNQWKKTSVLGVYHFFSKYTASGTMLWEKHEDSFISTTVLPVSSATIPKESSCAVINFKDQFLYISHYVNSLNTLYDGQRYVQPNGAWPIYLYSGMNLKVDHLGNILWGFRTQYPFIGMGTDNKKNLYFGGDFSRDSISFGPFKAKIARWGGNDAFVGKTFDYSIFRGPVKAGPYCAGDTFKVSYTKTGEFGDSNVFYAELSDENGDFIGRERILGSIKTKDSGTIVGTIPLFQVASSGKYRIRIRSTSPQAQSFYRFDALRLLIYSRDKADPGPTETICRGDTIMIKTFGGTKWTWSPQYRMNDSNSRTPLVCPDKTTQYRIVIADSSGCGQPDTAYKTVRVITDPQIRFKSPDTIACKASTVTIIASFLEGDSLYVWDWFALNSQGNFNYIKTKSENLSDTLHFKLASTENDSQQLMLYLRDGCEVKTGIGYYTVRVNKDRPDILFPGKDTLVCPGKPVSIIANFQNGNKAGYNWQWFEMNTLGQWIPGSKSSGNVSDTLLYTMPVNWKRNKLIRIVLSDNCADLADTAIYTLIPSDTLRITLNTADTLLCRGQSYTWKANGSGGDHKTYGFKWIDKLTGQVLSFADSLKFDADSAIQVQLTLGDGCMPNQASRMFTLTVRPWLTGTITDPRNNNLSDSILCYGQPLKLTSSSSGGNNKYHYKWLLKGKVVSSADNLQLDLKDHFSKSGDSGSLVFILSDQCTISDASASISLKMLPELSGEGRSTDSICYKGKALFSANGKGGKGNYLYKWWDTNFKSVGNSDSLLIAHSDSLLKGNIIRYVVIFDGCSLPADTLKLSSYFRSPLSLKLRSSDSCTYNSALLTAMVSGGKTPHYNVSWWKLNSFVGANKGSLTVFPDADLVLYKAVANDGCSLASDTSVIYVGLGQAVKLYAKGFCLGDTTFISLDPAKLPTVYTWKINQLDISVPGRFYNAVFNHVGNYKVNVKTANFNCKGSDSISFRIVEKPIADFDYSYLGTSSTSVNFHFINKSVNSNAWLWTFNNSYVSVIQNPKYSYTDTGFSQIRLIANNQNLCFDTIVKKIPVMWSIKFFLPNVFSPDGNGINEGFGLNENQHYLVKYYSLTVFNRWGEKVFETDKAHELWNGDKCQQGVYIFFANITDIYGRVHMMKGPVEVLR